MELVSFKPYILQSYRAFNGYYLRMMVWFYNFYQFYSELGR